MKHMRRILAALSCALLLAVPASADAVDPTLDMMRQAGPAIVLILAAALIAVAAAIIIRIVRKRRRDRNGPK